MKFSWSSCFLWESCNWYKWFENNLSKRITVFSKTVEQQQQLEHQQQYFPIFTWANCFLSEMKNLTRYQAFDWKRIDYNTICKVVSSKQWASRKPSTCNWNQVQNMKFNFEWNTFLWLSFLPPGSESHMSNILMSEQCQNHLRTE